MRGNKAAVRRGRFISMAGVMVLVSATLTISTVMSPPPVSAAAAVYRVNAGGPAVTGSPGWTADTTTTPSAYVNAAANGNTTTATTTTINMTDPSIPAGTPSSLFTTERWDRAGSPEMQWNFPATSGERYDVRLYFAETDGPTKAVGARVFDVTVDGRVVLDNYDVFAKVGGDKAVMEHFTITADSNIDIDFVHGVENPNIKAIEVVPVASTANQLAATPAS